MCTLIALHRRDADRPLIVAANRDERVTRPSRPIHVWPTGVLAPRDEEKGGTWLGMNAQGLFVGITNRVSEGQASGAERESRGALVVEALGAPSARALHATLEALARPRRFNPFHLLYADRSDAFMAWSDGERLVRERLAPGAHVLTERSFGAVDSDRASRDARVRALLEALPDVRALSWAHLATLLGLPGVCVHAPERAYGTRSSCVLTLGSTPGSSELYWSEGPACENDFTDMSGALQDLLASAR